MDKQFQSKQKMKFNKTETEYNMKSIRFLLLTITAMFIVVGILMIVLGISVYSHYHSFSFFYMSAKGGSFFTPSIMSVLGGFMLLIVTSFGFFGTLKQSTCLVNIYALILSLILIVKLVIVILAFTMGTDAIMKYIDIPISKYTADPEVQDEIDRLQVSLNCCGSASYMDYIHSDFMAHHETTVVNKEVDGQLFSVTVPKSCCSSAGEFICNRMRSNSCKSALSNLIVQNSSVLGVMGVSVMFIQLLGIIFAIMMARTFRKLKSERALMSWKIKEQMILAKQAQNSDHDQAVYITTPESSTA